MQAPREARKIINAYRKRESRRGFRNGRTGWLDDLRLERVIANSKRRYRRRAAVDLQL